MEVVKSKIKILDNGIIEYEKFVKKIEERWKKLK